MSGCGALVAVVSHRGEGKTSSYILREIEFASSVGLPALALVENGVDTSFERWPNVIARPLPPLQSDISAALDGVISDFAETVGEPPRPAHAFFGHSFDGTDAETWSCVRRCIEVDSGLPCISGDSIAGGDVQHQIIERIRDATFCVFDITEDRLNSCIEAGIALGADTAFELVCKAPRRRPPFIFRHRQVWFYETPTELIGLVRKLALPYRRVVN
jgi:hypothetical protein